MPGAIRSLALYDHFAHQIGCAIALEMKLAADGEVHRLTFMVNRLIVNSLMANRHVIIKLFGVVEALAPCITVLKLNCRKSHSLLCSNKNTIDVESNLHTT